MHVSPVVDAARRRLLGHGALLLFAGGLIGFGFLFFLVGDIRLWPIPGQIDVQLPGSERAWRMAHLEGIINGFALWIAAAVLPLLRISDVAFNRVANGLIVVGWSFVIGSLIGLIPDSRGLAFDAPLTNRLGFLVFYPGVAAFMIMTPYIAWKALTGRPSANGAG